MNVVRPLIALAAACLGGCNLLTLDGLQAGGDGGGASAAVTADASSAVGSSSSSASTATATTTTSSGASSGGGAAATTASGSGGQGGSGGSVGTTGSGGGGGAGGACVSDFCAGGASTDLCDDFDEDEDLDGWEQTTQNAESAELTVVDDRSVSCPHSARIEFGGVVMSQGGGWAQLGNHLPGSPTSVTMRVQIWREPTIDGREGVLEMLWKSGGQGCVVQVHLGTSPASLALYSNQYDAEGNGTELGNEGLDLGLLDTEGRWLDMEMVVELGATPSASVTIDGQNLSFPLDVDGAASCDAGADDGSFQALFGPPYNQAPTVLYADDYVVTATD